MMNRIMDRPASCRQLDLARVRATNALKQPGE
jgi:hypothetical protein